MKRCILDSFMQSGGEDYEIIRNGDITTAKGLPNSKEYNGGKRECIQFYADTDVKKDDTIIRKITGDKWIVTKVDPFVYNGEIEYITVFYSEKNEPELQKSQSINYNFHNSSNIIAGNQSSATININIESIKNEIELHGNNDKEELLKLIEEIKQTFDKDEIVTKSSLLKYSEMLEKHSWITSSLVQLVGSLAIKFLFR